MISRRRILSTCLALPALTTGAAHAATFGRVALQEAAKVLAALTGVSYHYERELNYASENFRHRLEGEVTVEFDALQPVLGARYQVRSASGFEVYNGSEILLGNPVDHTIQMIATTARADLDLSQFLFNSMLTLRWALPILLADPAVTVAVVAESDAAVTVELRLPRAVLNASGSLRVISLQRDTLYRILLDRQTWLPREVRQGNSQNDDFMLVRFSRVATDPTPMPAQSWYYSSYPDYRLALPGPKRELLSGNATPWTLPLVGEARTVSLADMLMAHKLLLLEFWISHCGHSIDAVAGINTLSARFKGEGLGVLAINTNDDGPTIAAFARNTAPRFALAAEGGKVAEQYGVSGFPTVFLIDRQGRIRHASPGLNAEVLAKEIARHLQAP